MFEEYHDDKAYESTTAAERPQWGVLSSSYKLAISETTAVRLSQEALLSNNYNKGNLHAMLMAQIVTGMEEKQTVEYV